MASKKEKGMVAQARRMPCLHLDGDDFVENVDLNDVVVLKVKAKLKSMSAADEYCPKSQSFEIVGIAKEKKDGGFEAFARNAQRNSIHDY
jgi:hypothetical protein